MIGSFLYTRFYEDYFITAIDYGKPSIEENFSTLDLTQEEDIEAFAEKSLNLLYFFANITLPPLCHHHANNCLCTSPCVV